MSEKKLLDTKYVDVSVDGLKLKVEADLKPAIKEIALVPLHAFAEKVKSLIPGDLFDKEIDAAIAALDAKLAE